MVVSTSPNPQAGGYASSALRDCLINTLIFSAALHNGGRSYCRKLMTRHDRDPLITGHAYPCLLISIPSTTFSPLSIPFNTPAPFPLYWPHIVLNIFLSLALHRSFNLATKTSRAVLAKYEEKNHLHYFILDCTNFHIC